MLELKLRSKTEFSVYTLEQILLHYLFSQEMMDFYEKLLGLEVHFVSAEDSEGNVRTLTPFTIKDGYISYFGMPTTFWALKDLTDQEKKQAFENTIKLFQDIYLGARLLCFLPLNLIPLAYSHIVSTKVELMGLVDLTRSDQEIRKSFRKSYRSLINWGHKHMILEKLDKTSISYEKFENFRLLHIAAAGKETRNIDTWKLQYEHIQKGKSLLYLGYLDNNLETGAIILKDDERAFYGISASNRELMSKNVALSHVIIEQAIFDAKKQGLKYFEFNDISPALLADVKLRSINNFKKGFCTDILPRVIYELLL